MDKLTKKKRPKKVKGHTEKVETGCGTLYVTINKLDDKPFELFAHLGRSGSCASCWCEALTRAISLGLKYGVPSSEYVDELSGIRCQNVNMWPEDQRVLSCPDGIAKVLKEEL